MSRYTGRQLAFSTACWKKANRASPLRRARRRPESGATLLLGILWPSDGLLDPFDGFPPLMFRPKAYQTAHVPPSARGPAQTGPSGGIQ